MAQNPTTRAAVRASAKAAIDSVSATAAAVVRSGTYAAVGLGLVAGGLAKVNAVAKSVAGRLEAAAVQFAGLAAPFQLVQFNRAWADLKAVIGQGFTPALQTATGVVRALADAYVALPGRTKVIIAIATAATIAVVTVGSVLFGLATTATVAVAALFGMVAAVVGIATSAVVATAAAVGMGVAVAGLAVTMGTAAVGMAGALVAVFVAALPIILVAAATFAAAFALTAVISKDAAEMFGQAWVIVKEIAVKVWGDLTAKFAVVEAAVIRVVAKLKDLWAGLESVGDKIARFVRILTGAGEKPAAAQPVAGFADLVARAGLKGAVEPAAEGPGVFDRLAAAGKKFGDRIAQIGQAGAANAGKPGGFMGGIIAEVRKTLGLKPGDNQSVGAAGNQNVGFGDIEGTYKRIAEVTAQGPKQTQQDILKEMDGVLTDIHTAVVGFFGWAKLEGQKEAPRPVVVGGGLALKP